MNSDSRLTGTKPNEPRTTTPPEQTWMVTLPDTSQTVGSGIHPLV